MVRHVIVKKRSMSIVVPLVILITGLFHVEGSSASSIFINNSADDLTADWVSIYSGEDGKETLIPWELSSIENFQPRMPPVLEAAPSNCPHDRTDLRDWNDPTLQWPSNGMTTSPPSPDGTPIVLPQSTSIIIRKGMLTATSSTPYGRITVPTGSSLIFDDTGTGDGDGEPIVLHTLGIHVDGGALEAGSTTCRLEGKIRITLHGTYTPPPDNGSDRHLADPAPDVEVKGIVVSDVPGARWDFHGKLYHPTWTRLAAPVPGYGTGGAGSTPSVRNAELFLQDCVNWPQGGTVVVTTSHVKDTRSYNYNEEGIIKNSADSVRCVTIDGKQYGKITLEEPLLHYHHAGEREYQCEVLLTTRNIVIQGNQYSEPTDTTPIGCPTTYPGFTDMPCPNTFLTGFGGHTIIMGQSEGRLRGIEFYRMGMTNVVGRYPVHFHYSTTGSLSAVTDCSVHRSYYRAYTIHNTFHLDAMRNTAYDVTGHAFYLESGVEEFNRVEYNMVAFVHSIDGTVIMSATETGSEQTSTISVPADHTASPYYISNVHNYIIGNAASGGWAGMQFPILPQPADPKLRFNGVVPKDRPSLLISGNSVHSSSWFGLNTGSYYSGGSLYWEEDDSQSVTLKYNAGRVGTARLTRDTKGDGGENVWFKVYNSTAWLVNVGATGWGRRSEYRGFEVHDFQRRGIFVLFTVWLDRIVLNCRTSNAPKVPDPGTGYNERTLNDGRSWSGFFTYDHLMRHILTDWKMSNCGGVARGLEPWVPGGQLDTLNNGLFTVPVNGFGPEIQLISSGFQYDWDTMGGRNFTNESIFFGGSGAEDVYSMQYMSNWEDADGSMTQSTNRTVFGPARAGKWWHLDYRQGQCEIRSQWKFPQMLCNKENRHLASMFTVVMPQINTQGSAVFKMLYTNGENERKIRQGSMTHFGFTGDSSILTCTPPETCDETTSRSWDADLTGPFNHAQYGGWYLSFDLGTPAEMTVQRVQMEEGTIMLQAMNCPSSTVVGDIHVWAESFGRAYDFTLGSSLDEVRSAEKGDLYWFDLQTKTLYWRVITGYVETDLTFDWIDRARFGLETFTRSNLSVADITGKSQFQLHIDISCTTDGNAAGAFCLEKPSFIVPGMGCTNGEVMLSIDECGLQCELENNCNSDNPSSVSSSAPTPAPTSAPTPAPTPAPTSDPTTSPTTSDPSLSPSSLPTPHPSPDPTSSPTTSGSCSDSSNGRFYFKTNNKGKHIYKTCKWLRQKKDKKVNNVCRNKVGYQSGYGPPQDICVSTCKSCDICYENRKSKFFLRMKKDEPVYKTCKWLAKQQNTAELCQKTSSNDDYGPPRDACPKVCSVGLCAE